jgi:hypothetical protein
VATETVNIDEGGVAHLDMVAPQDAGTYAINGVYIEGSGKSVVSQCAPLAVTPSADPPIKETILIRVIALWVLLLSLAGGGGAVMYLRFRRR